MFVFCSVTKRKNIKFLRVERLVVLARNYDQMVRAIQSAYASMLFQIHARNSNSIIYYVVEMLDYNHNNAT